MLSYGAGRWRGRTQREGGQGTTVFFSSVLCHGMTWLANRFVPAEGRKVNRQKC